MGVVVGSTGVQPCHPPGFEGSAVGVGPVGLLSSGQVDGQPGQSSQAWSSDGTVVGVAVGWTGSGWVGAGA